MSEDEKLRFILIVSAIVAALAVHRFLETSQALAHPTGIRFFTSDEFGVGSDWLRPLTSRGAAQLLQG